MRGREAPAEALCDHRHVRTAPVAEELDAPLEFSLELRVGLSTQLLVALPGLEPGDGSTLLCRRLGKPVEDVPNGP